MKATGIVRRIDDLGRIVIPKEIRRTLRIRETDPMEIFTDREGQIILKKYSPIGELAASAGEYADTLAMVSKKTVCITDRDQVVAAAGSGRKELSGKPLTKELDSCIANRESVTSKKGDADFVQAVTDMDFENEVICPVICSGDVLGSVIILDKEAKSTFTDVELKLGHAFAEIIGKQMEG
ncbi:MAG: stage V sporulation T C-terminal domain-containing protein [Eubacteriales bacterium]|nr:stage V sporulation T C-terminal domain-containing protein [Eubacteriales bacterium]